MHGLWRENSKLREAVEQQKAVILKLKIEKKMHKADMHYRDRKDCAFLVLFSFLHCVWSGGEVEKLDAILQAGVSGP
jgi:hypothetical protein